ncbi:MAG: Ig-like domain-containing protein [Cytophagales bacterium]|nr:Ig-like domain-containing protein [Cytophagales bacterium]
MFKRISVILLFSYSIIIPVSEVVAQGSSESLTPTIISTRPNELTFVSLQEDGFHFSFDVPVSSLSGEARLVKTSTGEIVRTSTIGDNWLDDSIRKIRHLDFGADLLEASTVYHIEIDSNAYQDESGNLFGGLYNSVTWSFKTEDAKTDSPKIIAFFPQNGASGIQITKRNFEFHLSRAVSAVAGQARLVKTATNEVLMTTDLLFNGRLFGHDPRQGFNFDSDGTLEYSTKYHIEIDSASYRDIYGNLVEAILDSTIWSFTTILEDTIPPKFTRLIPPNASENIGITQNKFRMFFDKPVSIIEGEASLIKTATSEAVATVDVTDFSFPSSRIYQDLEFGDEIKLEALTDYHIEIDSGSYRDVFGNIFEGVHDSLTWTFTTEKADNAPPIIKSQTPGNGEVGVDVSINTFGLVFDEVVESHSGEARMIKTSTGEIIKTTTEFWDANGYDGLSVDKYFFFDQEFLEPSTKYHIEIDEKVFRNSSDIFLEGISDSTIWSFTTAPLDTLPPVATNSFPINGATGVSITQTLFSIYFDEPVIGIGGEARIIKTATGEVVKTKELDVFTSPKTSINLNFNSDLFEPSTEYYLEIDAGSYQDSSGNEFEGIADSNFWAFTTSPKKTEHPPIVEMSPLSGASDVKVDLRSVTLNFEERTNPAYGEVRLIKTKSNKIIKFWNPITNNGLSYSVHPTTLEPSTTYHIEIDSGSFVDYFGNEFEGINDTTLSFTTESGSSDLPRYYQFLPESRKTNVSVAMDEFQIRFGSPVNSLEGEVMLIESSTGEVVKIANIRDFPEKNSRFHRVIFQPGFLKPETRYHLEVDDAIVESIYGVPSKGFKSPILWNFITQSVDEQPPVARRFSPWNLADDVGVGTTDFVIYFNEKVIAREGSAYLFNADSDELVGTLKTQASEKISESHTLQYAGDLLLPEQSYYIQIDSNVFFDGFENTFRGIYSPDKWVFKTQAPETQMPEITELSPGNGSIRVDLSTNYFMLVFDEHVKPVDGTASIVETATGQIHETIPINQSAHSNTQILQFEERLLKPRTKYRILIDPGAYEDLFGNPFAGFEDDDWTFVTGVDETAPFISSTVPSNRAEALPNNFANFSITFNEEVQAVNGLIHLFDGDSGDPVSSTTVEGTEKTFFFSFDTTFTYDTPYYIEIDEYAFENANGIRSEPYLGSEFWSFTIGSEKVLGFANEPSVQLFPNPAQNFVNLSVKQQDVSVAIFTLVGTKVIELNVTNRREQIDVSALRNGVYTIQIRDHGKLIYESRMLKKN